MSRPRPPRRPGRKPRRNADPPDILYHATNAFRLEEVRDLGFLELQRGQGVYLSETEEAAWRVAHRNPEAPVVLYVDAAKVRRDGHSFAPVRVGLWQVERVPARAILNLHPGFAEQVSAGGVMLWEGPEGPRLALIRVRRRFGATWEVAKGKMEPCETPAQTALREMTEEMGLSEHVSASLKIRASLGAVRYGFQTPAGDPRLKTLHLFLVSVPEQVTEFHPAHGESIEEVGWFTPAEAARLVHHRSLKPMMARVHRLFQNGGRI